MDERTRQSINKQTHRSTQSTNNEDPIIHHYPTPKFPPTGVRYNRYERDRTISFVPPDGQFELMRYRVTPKAAQIIPPIYCSMQVGKLTRLGWWWCYSLCVCVCRVHYLRMYVYRSISCIMTTPPLHARLFPSPIHIISPQKKNQIVYSEEGATTHGRVTLTLGCKPTNSLVVTSRGKRRVMRRGRRRYDRGLGGEGASGLWLCALISCIRIFNTHMAVWPLKRWW